MSRTARIERATSESSVIVEIDLDGTGQTDISTTVPFYDHMLTALGRHSLIDLTVRATGDTEIDVHHTVEDTAICIGEALRVALGDKRGIRRFGEASVPLDEALAHAVVDISGRPYLVHEGESEAFVHHLIGGHFTGSRSRWWSWWSSRLSSGRGVWSITGFPSSMGWSQHGGRPRRLRAGRGPGP